MRTVGVTLLYAVYLGFLLYAMIDHWHLSYVVIVCLGLHFAGLAFSKMIMHWDVYPSRWYPYVDAAQLIVLVLVAIRINDDTIGYIGASVAIVGVLTCFHKFQVIREREKVVPVSGRGKQALESIATSRPLIF